jgi:hypothetical protein
MLPLLRREFTVELPLERAWQHLARVERWPSWAKHIERVELRPPGELGSRSTGIIRLRNGIRSAFAMAEYDPPRRWEWVGRFLWLTVRYDHRFEELGPRRTKLTWEVRVAGFGVSVLGRLFAGVYARNLDGAIPLLIEEMNAG